MTTFVEIDGATGEGGGQILRSALSLSLATNRPLAMVNIRANRDRSGLMRQHLTAVRAAAAVGHADVTGDEIGSHSLQFVPHGIVAGDYHFSVGTAGSSTLVFQTVLPALMLAPAPSYVTIEGGTHNPAAPPFDYLANVYLPLLQRMGLRVSAELERYGFFPAGGGRFRVHIQPQAGDLSGLELLTRGEIQRRYVRIILSGLPRKIGEREQKVVMQRLNWPVECGEIVQLNGNHGPGNVVQIGLEYAHISEQFTGFGCHGVSAERVASKVVAKVRKYQLADAPVGQYLADQLILPLSIAAWRSGATSIFRTLALTRHTMTQLDLIQRFLDVSLQVDADDMTTEIRIG